MRSHPAMTADVMIIFAMIFVVSLVISLRRRLKIAPAVRVLTYASMRPGACSVTSRSQISATPQVACHLHLRLSSAASSISSPIRDHGLKSSVRGSRKRSAGRAGSLDSALSKKVPSRRRLGTPGRDAPADPGPAICRATSQIGLMPPRGQGCLKRRCHKHLPDIWLTDPARSELAAEESG
jgi:hypothetical protein